MTEAREVAERFYRAMAEQDGHALVELVHAEFSGRVSVGMPLGVGGKADGPERILRGVWLTIAGAFETAPQPDEFVDVGPQRVIVFGHYRGRARDSGRTYEAAFCHDITARDARARGFGADHRHSALARRAAACLVGRPGRWGGFDIGALAAALGLEARAGGASPSTASLWPPPSQCKITHFNPRDSF